MDKCNNGEKVAWALVQAGTTAKVIGSYAESLSHLSDAITTSNDTTSEVAAMFIGADPRSLDLDENTRLVMQAAFYAYMTSLETQVRVAQDQIARNLADVERTHKMLEEVVAANRPVCSWCGSDATDMYDTDAESTYAAYLGDENGSYEAVRRFMCAVHARCSEADGDLGGPCQLGGFAEITDAEAAIGPGVRLLCCNHAGKQPQRRIYIVRLLDMGFWRKFNPITGEVDVD